SFQVFSIFFPRHPVDSCCCLLLQALVAASESLDTDVVQQGCELQFLIPLCCFPHTVKPTWLALPTLRPARARLSHVPLGRRPSLHRLLQPSQAFVRLLRRYYAAVRLPAAVHPGLIAHRLLPAIRVILPTDSKRGLSVLAREVSMHAWGLRLRRVASALAFTRTAVLLSVLPDDVSTLIGRFRSSLLRDTQPAYAPSQRFKCHVATPSHGSGSGWFATPFLCDSFIHYFTPVYPDAIQGTAPPRTKFVRECCLVEGVVGPGLAPPRPAPSGAGARLPSHWAGRRWWW